MSCIFKLIAASKPDLKIVIWKILDLFEGMDTLIFIV